MSSSSGFFQLILISSLQTHPSKHWLCLINVRLNSATSAEASVVRWPSQMWPKYRKQLLPVVCFRVFPREKGESFLSLVMKLAINFPVTPNVADVRRSGFDSEMRSRSSDKRASCETECTLSNHARCPPERRRHPHTPYPRSYQPSLPPPPPPKIYSQHALFSLV